VLQATLASRQGAFALELEVSVARGSVLVIVGESGSGKTTLLRLLAGLLRPQRGRIAMDATTWFDSGTGVFVPAPGRPIGYVAQDYALFPHLSAAENVDFGLRALGLAKRDRQRRVSGAMERLNIAPLAGRRPRELSGGQQQRVAIARALVLGPSLLLLDEPLSALDVPSRRSVRVELRKLLESLSCATVYVTHHPTEALVFGETIAVLESGRISQRGTRDDLIHRPRSAFAAEFLGVNLLRGTVVGREPGGLSRVSVAGGEVLVPGTEAGEVTMTIHPREITLALERPSGSARNVFEGEIDEIVPEPPRAELARLSLATMPPLVAQVTREAIDELGLAPGRRVYASFKASAVSVADS
jgi:molybdate transport system ATP-binding protein